MVDLSTISDTVDIAKSYYLELIEEHRQQLITNCDNCDDKKSDCLKWLIKALSFDIIDNYNTDLTQELYKRLLEELSGFSGSYTYDPNVVIPGQTIVIEGGLTVINRTEVDLIQDENSQWYLPVLDDDGDNYLATSIYVIYNGVSLPGAQLITTEIPYRIYGFIDNTTAIIKVTLN